VEIIVTHDMADFDAFAATVAAQLLYPSAVIVLGRRLSHEVREYLALHKDRFRTAFYTELDPARVRHLIIVDVRRKSRLQDFAEVVARGEAGDIEVSVFDHHPAAEDDVRADHLCVERVGSATTLLVDLLRQRRVELDGVTATLFLLGIHADTGSLTYGVTTARDAAAVAWLLERGANVAVLSRYLRPAFSGDQRALLRSLLDSIAVRPLGPLRVGFCHVRPEHVVDGVAEVVSEVAALTGYAAVFVVVELSGTRVQVVARSASPLLDVGAIVRSIGGGGHAGAASASFRHPDARAVFDGLVARVAEMRPEARSVAQLMSSPVHCVSPSTPLGEVHASLASWRHTGVPVVREGKLVGIVSHRDVERAERAGRLSLPVSSAMIQNVKTVDADAAPEEALALMQAHDVGRLPVFKGGHLVGIVTRSDLLALLYGPSGPPAT